MELTKKEISDALAKPFVPRHDPRFIERFEPLHLAQILERETARCRVVELSHVMVNLTLDDAEALARFLRRGALLGA